MTNEALVAVSELPALTALDLNGCCRLTEEGLRAIRGKLPALTTLSLHGCSHVTDVGIRHLSSLTALTILASRCQWGPSGALVFLRVAGAVVLDDGTPLIRRQV